jgi:ribosomal protein S18 acetylase RimI-like enzyme
MTMVEIDELNQDNLNDAGRCEGEFVIDSRLVPELVDGRITCRIESLPRRTKRYAERDDDYQEIIKDPARTIFLAYLHGRVIGEIVLKEYWNNTAYIEDIVVDARFRRQGAGRALIESAKQWAREHRLAGIMLETQDVNVAACRLYESCGLKLRGIDTYLYRAIENVSGETALYWYYLFDEEEHNQAEDG